MGENENKEMENRQGFTNSYKNLIISLVLIIIVFTLGIVAIDLFTETPHKGDSIINTPNIDATPKPIPDVNDIRQLSNDLLNLEANEKEWAKKDEDPEDEGLYLISENNDKFLVYHIDSENIADGGYTLYDFTYMWINSEDDDFYAVINISGKRVDLSNYYILVRDETRNYASRAIINCYEATEVILNNTILTGTIIAPNAHVYYEDTYVYGQVHAKSYEVTMKFHREIVFTGYANLMYDLVYADIKVDAVRIAAIEFLVENDTLGTYSHYTSESKLRLADTQVITSLVLDDKDVEEIGSDLAFFENLTHLSINNTNLSRIDLTYAPGLKYLSINDTSVAELDISHTPYLEYLSAFNTEISSLDLSNTPNLYYMNLDDTNIEELDTRNLQMLLNLSIRNTPIKDIDLSSNTKLINYACAGTILPVPDLGSLKNLEYLDLSNTNLESIEIGSDSLKVLDISRNEKLSSFDFSLFPNLEKLDISSCNISEFNFEKAGKLKVLNASFNKFSTIDLSELPTLTNAELYGDTVKTIIAKSYVKIYCDSKVEVRWSDYNGGEEA